MPSTLTEHPNTSAAPVTGWDTEVFVLRGDDRASLRDRTLSLVVAVEQQPGATLPDIAALLASEMRPGGARLTVVAGSHADLITRLNRAADRLADPKCKQLRDANGIYYFDSPLAEQGTVAVLFPGEGAQYLNMLADVCAVFPEVEDAFAWCDRVAIDAGRPEESMRRMLHLPPDATAEDRAAAETVLRGLGPSIFGVLLADQALFRVIENLKVPVSAMAGHSAGELGALLASGAMRSQEEHGSRLPEIMDIMQRQEGDASGPEAVLLAVGASKTTIMEVANRVAVGEVIVAMDNCPHQCVAVGPAHAVVAVEAALIENGVIAERLPFKRPYHTPLFEPYMGALRELFVNVPFSPTNTSLYSCSTGTLFPADPDAMRELAVNHWVTPVEFTRMIETMHADGVRLFIECGPRGNLSAFVEDILRGKPCAAIPANVTRKSGPTQINHMVAQLVAHGVDLNLAHLYTGRPTPPASLPEGKGEIEPSRAADAPAHACHEAAPVSFSPSPPGREAGGVGSSAILHNYLDVMEQFLDAQREVMSAFLGGHVPSVGLPPEMVAFPDLTLPPVADAPGSPEPQFALVETVLNHEPEREIVFRRVMDVREDLYADEHTLGGRGVSREDPSQNGLPVLPMTFSLEAMSEAASLLAPGKVVIAIRNVRLFRWLPFDAEPTTLEVRASVASVDPATGIVEVTADVRDLGNSFLRDATNKPSAEAVVILADRYPDPPEPHQFDLTGEKPCKSTVADLRRNMFHGPMFEMIRTLDRVGREGIEGTLEVQPRDGWFRSNPNPRYALDPVLLDAAMHLIGAWHLEQPDWTGRILLPFELQKVEYFGPTPEVGSRVLVRGHNEQESARHFRHGLEVFDTNGNPWLRLTGAGYWRFYLPFGEVNFHGPKDEYFLSRDWPEAVGANPSFARCRLLEPPPDLKQPVLRAAGARVTLAPNELAIYENWLGTDAELNDWYFSRLIAKDAVRAAWIQKHGEAMYPADIETGLVDGRVTCRPRGTPKLEPFPAVHATICEGRVTAVCAFVERVGCSFQVIAKNATPEVERETRAKVACLALAEALRVSVESCTLELLDASTDGAIVTASGGRFRVQTAWQKDMIVATTLCEPA